jgi:group I intron endonuclease
MQGIYGIYNTVSDKWYVGQASDINQRWAKHKSSLSLGKHDNTHIQFSYNKYGANVFEFVVLEEVAEFSSLTEREEFYVQHKRNTSKGVYNQRIVAGSNFGIKFSPESCLKLSLTHKGKTLSPEHRAKIGAAGRGRKHSPESCEKISAAHKGKKFSPETRAKMSAAQLGKVMSSETRAKIGATSKGRKPSLETLARLSAARRAFSSEQVAEILKLRAEGCSGPKLAVFFNVSNHTIYRVLNREDAYKNTE